MAPVKKTSKAPGTRASKKRTVRSVKPTILKSLPESVEHIQIVQQVASVLEELQNRVLDVREEASKELKKLMNRYETHYQGIEKKVHKVTLDAKKQAQTSMIHILQKWHEHKEKLPTPLAKEIEKIIEQIGTKMMKSPSASKTAKAKAKTKTKTSAPRTASATKSASPRRSTKKAKAIVEPDIM